MMDVERYNDFFKKSKKIFLYLFSNKKITKCILFICYNFDIFVLTREMCKTSCKAKIPKQRHTFSTP